MSRKVKNKEMRFLDEQIIGAISIFGTVTFLLGLVTQKGAMKSLYNKHYLGIKMVGVPSFLFPKI